MAVFTCRGVVIVVINALSLFFSNLIVLKIYSRSCLGQEAAKGVFGVRVNLPPVHRSTTHDGGVMLSLQCWSSSRAPVNTDFYGFWFDPTGNWTQFHRFSIRRSIHSTTDGYSLDHWWVFTGLLMGIQYTGPLIGMVLVVGYPLKTQSLVDTNPRVLKP